MRERVVVTGIGCISSLGTGVGTFAAELLAGHSGIAPITAFDTAGCRSHTAALLRDFDPSRYIDPLKLRRIDDVGRLALAACRLAIEEARLPTKTDRVGVALGSATAGLHSTIAHMHALATAGPASVPALTFSTTVGNSAASLCAIEYGLRGPNITFAQKQASSLAAIAYAVTALRDGRADAFVGGGVDAFEARFYQVHDRFRVMSPTDDGEEVSRPFDRRRNGFILGSGGHLLVLERARAAVERQATIVAEILGMGTAGTLCDVNQWPASPDGIVRAMRLALCDAAVEPREVGAVFSSANSTRVLDATEAAALREVFGPRGVPVIALKGALGEFGASGAAALTAAVGCLGKGALPPTAGTGEPDETFEVDLSSAARPSAAPLVLVNSTAVGGSHYSLLVRVLGRREFEPAA